MNKRKNRENKVRKIKKGTTEEKKDPTPAKNEKVKYKE